jgi:maltose/moltooligosaccharide transporter
MRESRGGTGSIWNMNFGFLGIQFGWGLQLANMSPIYTKLGASADGIPLLWLAGPMTGLIVQPIIGSMSDRTWTRLGRRRPYFLVGAILASIALFLMPESPSVRVAAGLLWILDASINVTMEPFRAFVADKLEGARRTVGFVVQSFFIGLGAVLANALPFLLRHLGVDGSSANGLPLTVVYSFRAGAFAFLLAVLWTIVTTGEEPPADPAAVRAGGVGRLFGEIGSALADMPRVMKQLAVVQFLTWLGLFCMWMFFNLAIARHVFGAVDEHSPEFDRAIEWGGLCFALYSAVCFAIAFALPALAARTSRKTVHAVALTLGGVALLSVGAIGSPWLLLATMVGVGIAWASILSMPYAMLASAIPASRVGVYMGVFNLFIVLPEIVASLTFKPIVEHVFGNDPLYVVVTGGVCLLAAAACVRFVDDEA